MQEAQFRRLFQEAARFKGVTGTRLLQLLELRLDNVVYRLGLAASRKEARQLVAHGHVTVDGRKVTIPSYLLRPGQRVGLTARGQKNERVRALLEGGGRQPPAWLEFDPQRAEGRVLSLPGREAIDVPVQEQLVVEFYSR
ncbi:30S ribosomal protein S4 [bacterium HR32]|nr:30S ribosomal protein S4 [bacterium HR32]